MPVELLPDDVADDTAAWCPQRAVPVAVRGFGKFPQVESLEPGDLILTRAIQPDRISTAIQKTQISLGYDEFDSKWTHAALYVGDGLRVIEATFESVLGGGAVKTSFLWDYCGGHALRFRRPKGVARDPNGWMIAIEAAMCLGKSYDFAAALSLYWKGREAAKTSWDARTKKTFEPGVICSTLYADCYNRVTGRCLGEGGTCVPASLSVSNEFNDLVVAWCPISRRS